VPDSARANEATGASSDPLRDCTRDSRVPSKAAAAMRRHLLVVLTFLAFLSLSLAACRSCYIQHAQAQCNANPAAPTSFCKCTCFGNSTIVALDGPRGTSKPNLELRPRASKKSCNDCNRQFCLSYSFCKGEKDENVFTTCFQRDSTKDQVVVLSFIAATVGLLSYAAVRPWVDQWREVCRREFSCFDDMHADHTDSVDGATCQSQKAIDRRKQLMINMQL
jgi:hypothetical protein